MDPVKKKVEGYLLYIGTFVGLSALTLLAVGLTQVRIASPLVIGLIMVIAAIQAIIVLFYNMHLKFHDKILTIFVGVIFSLIFLLIIITMLDFVNR
jgi:caa(3)-type oxidase subunit IV